MMHHSGTVIFLYADYSMVNFIKPKFLGSKADFTEKYANPIQDGQHKDSSDSEVRVMKEKSYILHKKMSKYVQVGCPINYYRK